MSKNWNEKYNGDNILTKKKDPICKNYVILISK